MAVMKCTLRAHGYCGRPATCLILIAIDDTGPWAGHPRCAQHAPEHTPGVMHKIGGAVYYIVLTLLALDQMAAEVERLAQPAGTGWPATP